MSKATQNLAEHVSVLWFLSAALRSMLEVLNSRHLVAQDQVNLSQPKMSDLPAFLVKESGINSGFMIPQVTAAALVSENKTLAFPASVDSVPTSANQEDHVSMACHAARRLLEMNENLAVILGIEAMAAAQGIEYRAPLETSPTLQNVIADIRAACPALDEDRMVDGDIGRLVELVSSGSLATRLELS